jgi:toxin ParE1/3/4
MQRRQVIIVPQAQQHLLEIQAYLTAENPQRAQPYMDGLFKKIVSLSTLAEAFAYVCGFAEEELRRRPVQSHIVVYRVLGDTVYVVGVFHAARDYAALLLEQVDG